MNKMSPIPITCPIRVAQALLLCALSLLLGACNKPKGDDYFPLAAGHQWTYHSLTNFVETQALTSTEKPVQQKLQMRTKGSESLEGLETWVRTSNSGVTYWLRTNETGIYRVATKGPLDNEPILDTMDRYVLKKPYAVGTSWEAFTTTFVYHRRNEVPRELRQLKQYQKIMMQFRIAAVGEKVKVPAGEFDNCLRVEGVATVKLYVDEALTFREVPFYEREWYCQGVGLVKLEREETSPTRFLIGGKQVLELTSWN